MTDGAKSLSMDAWGRAFALALVEMEEGRSDLVFMVKISQCPDEIPQEKDERLVLAVMTEY